MGRSAGARISVPAPHHTGPAIALDIRPLWAALTILTMEYPELCLSIPIMQGGAGKEQIFGGGESSDYVRVEQT